MLICREKPTWEHYNMETMMSNFVDNLINSTLAYTVKLNDYCRLALKQEISENEADHLAAIYTDAETDPLLDFFITTLSPILAERIGLLDDETMRRHGNQQAWLREHLEQSLFDQRYRLDIQKLLQEQGFYQGPIDGILGQRSCEAFEQFRKSLQEQLKKQGLYNGAIDGELGEQSVTAVMKFQRNQKLKGDGVPGKKTLDVLQST